MGNPLLIYQAAIREIAPRILKYSDAGQSAPLLLSK
jgi:hypothetical protein